MTVAEVLTEIRNKCREIGAPVGILCAWAHVESHGTFNSVATNGNGAYCGVLQLPNGYGGCEGNERYDIGKSVACAWKQMQADRADFAKNGIPWEDWYYYGVYQQGLAGFKQILQHKNSKFSELAKVSATSANNLLWVVPSTEKEYMVYVSDWLKYWKHKINNLIEDYEPFALETNKNTGKQEDKPATVIEVLGKKVDKNDLLIGAEIVVATGLVWCYYKGNG